VIAPDATDKFFTGELHPLLAERGIRTLVITGASTNQAVLYTASSAARNFNYDVVIPLDGTNAARDYEYEYSIHQFTVVSFANKFRFTTLDMIGFDEA
jgi:nicotinamidase-related amidase